MLGWIKNWLGPVVGWIQKFLEWQGATPLAILLSVIIAVVAIWFARRSTRQQNAIDLLLSLQKEPKFWESLIAVRAQHNHVTPGDLHKIGELMAKPDELVNETDEMRGKVQNFRYIMNVFENMSVGIRHGIYDEGILKEMFRTSFIMTWRYVEPVVTKIRETRQKDTYYEVYEKVAEKWQKN